MAPSSPRRRRTTRPHALLLAGALALTVAACDRTPDALPEASVDDTSDTAGSPEVSGPADEADTDEVPDADATRFARVVFDGEPLPVAATTCDQGPEVTARLEDGGDLHVATEDDGRVTARIVVPRDGASLAWASDDDASGTTTSITFGEDGVHGETTVVPIDLDGAVEDGRDEAPLAFDLPCP